MERLKLSSLRHRVCLSGADDLNVGSKCARTDAFMKAMTPVLAYVQRASALRPGSSTIEPACANRSPGDGETLLLESDVEAADAE